MWLFNLSEYHTEPTVFMVRPVRSMRTVTPKPAALLGTRGCFFFAGIAEMLIFECWRRYEASTVKPGFYKP